MMRTPVLFVAMQTDAQSNGGVESLTQIALNAQRIRPILLTNIHSSRTARWREAGLETHVAPLGFSEGLNARQKPAARALAYLRYARIIRRLMNDTGIRLVHVNDPLALQLALVPVRMQPGGRLAFNIRGTLDPGRSPPRFKYGVLFAAADHTFFLSREMADYWAPYSRSLHHRSSVTYSIVDPTHFQPGGPTTEDRTPMVLVAGVVRELKGQLAFLEHVAPAVVAGGARLVFAGDFDPERDAYAAACARAAAPLGSAVSFLGFRRDLPDLIRAAAVVAIPSRQEGLVRVMIEAMACSRPVVSFDVCSAREILEREAPGAGVVVATGDHVGMSEALIRFCNDPVARAAAGAAGLAGAQRLFDPASVVARYEDVLIRLAGKSGLQSPTYGAEERSCAA